MIKAFLTSALAAGTFAVPAMAQEGIPTPHGTGMKGSYVGAGLQIGIDGGSNAASLSGRYDIPAAPISIRPQLTIGSDFGGNVALTADLPMGDRVNVYGGGGVGFGADTALNGSDDVIGYAVVGVEGSVADNIVVFADVKFGLTGDTTYVPTVGVGYRF